MASQGSIRVIKIRFLWIYDSFKFAESLPQRSQIGIRCSGTQKVFPEVRNRQLLLSFFFSCSIFNKKVMNPIRHPSGLPIQSPMYLWLQAAAWEAFVIGGWCVVSCTSIRILKFLMRSLSRLFESRCKDKVLATFILKSISRITICLLKY